MVERDGADVIVLVVDDEPLVLGMVATALRSFGLTVVTAGRGDEAVSRFEAHGTRIGAVLLDVQMEPWDGPRTLAALRRLDPAVPAAFMSGDTGRYSAAELLALGAARVFFKPFPNLAALAAALRELAAVSDPAGG